MATSKLPRDPLQPPPARPQPQHLRHVVRRLHHLPPWIFPRRGFRDSLLVHSLSPQLAKEGAIPRGAEGAVFHGARQRIISTNTPSLQQGFTMSQKSSLPQPAQSVS